jgi:DNA-binding NarL/FixJ family response regulator
LALARELLALKPALPVVVTSGYLRPEDYEAAERIGIRATILKPNTVTELAGVLDNILRS